jgi:Na+/H+ antiporter NhaD/arsenite permease-like protein
MAMEEKKTITDWPLLWQSLAVVTVVILAFVFARQIRLEPGTIGLFGAAVLMLLDNIEHHKERQSAKVTETFGEVDWITIFFFVGLFVVVHGLEVTGALAWLAQELVRATGGNLALTAVAILWASAFLSAIVDNIPFVATMIPLIKAMGPTFGEHGLLPLWWALSLGACLGGNGTLIGASANLTVAGIAERQGIPFGFMTYTKHALPLMLMSMVACHIYLWLRYL